MNRRTGAARARVGGRSARVVDAVLDAAIAELAQKGYAAMRVEDVADRAGVNKTTVYRRWPTKPDLVGAALGSLTEDERALPDTGSVRSDLLVLLRQRVRVASNPQKRAAARVLTTELDHPEVAAITRTVRELFRGPWIQVVERAIERGELPEGSDARLIVEVLGTTVSTRLFRLQESVGEGYLRALVDLVLDGAFGRAAAEKATPPPARSRRRLPTSR